MGSTASLRTDRGIKKGDWRREEAGGRGRVVVVVERGWGGGREGGREEDSVSLQAQTNSQ